MPRLSSVPDTSESESEIISEIVARTRREQGLPPTIQDPAILERVAAVFRAARSPAESEDGYRTAA